MRTLKSIRTCCVLLLVTTTLAGCELASLTLNILEQTYCALFCKSESDPNTDVMQASVINYTPYHLYGIRFSDASKPFNYGKTEGLGGGADKTTERNWGFGDGLYAWDKRKTVPVTLKVVWAVVYDELNSQRKGYDEYSDPRDPPGVVWCESLVTIANPYPTDRFNFTLEFFPDGTLKAKFTSISTPPEADRPLSFEQNYGKLPSLPPDQYCLKKTANPLYGLPKPKHFE